MAGATGEEGLSGTEEGTEEKVQAKNKLRKSSNKMCAFVPDYPLYEGDYDYGGGGGVPVDSSAVIF